MIQLTRIALFPITYAKEDVKKRKDVLVRSFQLVEVKCMKKKTELYSVPANSNYLLSIFESLSAILNLVNIF